MPHNRCLLDISLDAIEKLIRKKPDKGSIYKTFDPDPLKE